MEMEGGKLVIVKADPDCAICGGREQLVEFHEKHICRTCVNGLTRETTRV